MVGRGLIAGLTIALALPSAAAAATPSVNSIGATEDVALGASTVIATFSDGVAPLCPSASAYTATVNWGDGTPSTAGTVSATGMAPALAPCTYEISAGHTFSDETGQPLALSVSLSAGGAPSTGTGTATVADASLGGGQGAALNGTAGTALNGRLGTFTDTNSTAPASDYTASINWGDGSSPSHGTVAATGTAGVFAATGTHTYGVSGTYPVLVTISDDGGSTATLTATTKIAAGDSGGGSGGGGGTGGGGPGQFKLGLSRISVIRGSILSVRLSCPSSEATCRGRVIASMARGHGVLTLANAIFVLPGGSAAILGLRPTKGVLRAAARLGARRVTVSVVASDPTSGHVTAVSAGARVRFGRGGRTSAARARF